MGYIDKSDLVAEIKRLIAFYSKEIEDNKEDPWAMDIAKRYILEEILSFIDTLEVKDLYEQYVQYPSVKDAIQAHAEIYSFNIESELFNQLTKEQQALWRKEIEQACISGGEVGVELARDIRYKENLEVKEVDLNKEFEWFLDKVEGVPRMWHSDEQIEWAKEIAKHFFELGMQISNKE